ncbi:NlpC/P60 family protein [Nonomuraea muscovyensis]|uniref:Cell wall-associated NlpC family hydrolase n=1 Tax=Nonomuraea muscovyensis TaxID=1124761 RepID=A0A7X0BZK5_9ACTN|nr:NlpC/P60 family protein [Nonomuraea muscovyensis]MBB6345730.1 cell wall-associated NlpC family hydrolase [Nonomuraea muscovyensis]
MKRTRGRERTSVGTPARPPQQTGPRRLALLGTALVAATALVTGLAAAPAAADPKPSLDSLAKQVEQMHLDIEKLAEQFNAQREKLKSAKKTAEAAKKTLDASEADLAAKRAKAAQVVESQYMGGTLGRSLPFLRSGDPEQFLDSAATTYALAQQQGEQLKQVLDAMESARRARDEAKTRMEEVTELVSDLGAKRDKIVKMVAKVESNLYRRAVGEAGRPGTRATRVNLPVVGSGKAAEAARWALTQQLKPYVWGAEGPGSYDCSGLVMAAYQRVGISLPHYTGSQWTAGRHISKEELRAGDLVFFYNDLHHVGIYLGGGLMVHAPRTGDVVRVASIARRPFAGAVRVAD